MDHFAMGLRRVARYAMVLGALVLSSASGAHTTMRGDYVCPIGGEKFSQYVDSSGSSFGMGLDFKPWGPIVAPFRVPECPGNKFVMYRQDYPPALLEKLEAFVASPAYPRDSPQYYRIYAMQKHLGEPVDRQFWTLVQVTWNNYGPQGRYAREAIELADLALAAETSGSKKWVNTALLKGELQRRLGMFDEALDTFKLVEQAAADAASREPIVATMLECQRTLIDAKSANPSPVPGRHTQCGQRMPY
jgi:hypothetical protein